MNNHEVFLFPIDDPEYRVDSQDAYAHLMGFIVSVAVELEEEYPDKTVWVTYPVNGN